MCPLVFDCKMGLVSVMKVRLVSYTPHPDEVCNLAAGTCVSEGAPEYDGNMRALKGALASGHESVAEHASFTFFIEGVSRALSHQLVRHRIASYSQQSQRYVKMENFDYVTPVSIRDSEMECDTRIIADPDYAQLPEVYHELMCEIADIYEKFVNAGIPEEDARYILPNACTTNITMTMNARELRHFFRLRCCSRAQWEIRQLAYIMLNYCKEKAPVLFDDAGPSCAATGRCPEGKKSCGEPMIRKVEE